MKIIFKKWQVYFWLIFLLVSAINNFSVSLVNSQMLSKINSDPGDSLTPVRSFITKRALLEIELIKHTIKKGENLYQLSKEYFVPLGSLKTINNISNPNRIKEGLVLYIPPVDEKALFIQRYRVLPDDSLYSILKKYNIKLWQFRRLNPLVKNKLIIGTSIFLPSRPLKSAKSSFFIRPIRGFMTSRYGIRWGRMHYGLDLAAPIGTPVKAAGSGRVIFAGWLGSYGQLIKIKHGRYCTYYGHLSKMMVNRGELVKQGEIIGLVGATGRAYGSHLHFEVEQNGKKLNPYLFIRR